MSLAGHRLRDRIAYLLAGGVCSFLPGLTHAAGLDRLDYRDFALLPGIYGGVGKPVAIDLDGDNDIDLVFGTEAGTLLYYANTGSAQAPLYQAQTGAANPFAAIDVNFDAAPAFADLDADGDADLVLGNAFGDLHYYENTGGPLQASFVERSASANPFVSIDVGGFSTPSLADLDADGDYDVSIGGVGGRIDYLLNTGTPSAPVFSRQDGLANPLDAVDTVFGSAPTLIDLDGDTDYDAVVGGDDGRLRTYRNIGNPNAPQFSELTQGVNPLGAIDIGTASAPVFADFDADGDLDLAVSDLTGFLRFVRNDGDSLNFVVAPNLGPLADIDVGEFSAASFVDLDTDGDLDLVLGDSLGDLRYFENAGSDSAPSFQARTGLANPFDGIRVEFDSVPSFADVDGDGDADAIVGDFDGKLHYLQNQGNLTTPAFVELTSPVLFDMGFAAAPHLADVDGDGDPDLVVGSFDQGLRYFERTGDSSNWAYSEQLGGANPFPVIDLLANASPTTADLDGDGDLDLVLGQADGQMLVYENTGTTVAPIFVARTGALNPFSGLDAGSFSVPALADLDGDGDLDLFVGNASGKIEFALNQTSTNQAPIANDDAVSTSEDTPRVISVLANDTDADGDLLSLVSVTTAISGTTALVGDGTLRYTPAANFNGNDSFSYTISDGQGGTATATVSITVNAVNDAPVANADSASTTEETVVVVDVLANDTDADGDALTLIGVEPAGKGLVSIDASGGVRYQPDTNAVGSDSFSYTLRDTAGVTATATVQITIAAVNDPPTAVADSFSVNEDVAADLAVLLNDSDVDGDSLTIASFTTPASGTLEQIGSSLRYTPDPNFNGSDGFSYTISDGSASAGAAVSITVAAVDDTPVATGDSASVGEDGFVVVNVLANDTDADGDALSISGFSQAGSGTVASEPGGGLRYTPNPNFNGGDSFTYNVSDGAGPTGSASVSITVTPVNDAPSALDDTAIVAEDGVRDIVVLANDSDIDGDSLSIATVGAASHGTAVRNGTLITYTPAANFNGSDSFAYSISDGQGATANAVVNVVVSAVNDAPAAANDSASLAEDTVLDIPVLVNDTDVDGDSLSITTVGAAAHGNAVSNGAVITYTPAANYNGSDSFSYTISDGKGETANAVVSVTVTPVNDAPVAGTDSASTTEDTALNLQLLANDSDIDGDVLSVQSLGSAIRGTVSLRPDGSVDYQPDANFNGNDSFTYTLVDTAGATATGSVQISITPVNDAPVAADDTVNLSEDAVQEIAVLANDSDVDGDSLTLVSFTTPASGSLLQIGSSLRYTPDPNFNGNDGFSYTISDGTSNASANVVITVAAVDDPPVAMGDSASVSEDGFVVLDVLANDIDADGDALSISGFTQAGSGTVASEPGGGLRYTPNPDFNGSDSFTYNVSDGAGPVGSASVSLTVMPVNDAPSATDDSVSLNEDSVAVAVLVLANDSDRDGDTLSVLSVSTPSSGSTSLVGGVLAYTPNANFSGSDSFTYVVTDGQGGSAQASVAVTVVAVNDPPQAQADSATVDEDSAVTIPVLANDSDVDGDTLSVTAAGPAGSGSVSINADGTLLYTPAADFFGVDTFTYVLGDGRGATDTGSVTVAVANLDDAPVAYNDALTTAEDTAAVIDVLANDLDVDGDSLSLQSLGAALKGTVSIRVDGRVDYVPAADANGSDSFSYTLVDPSGLTASATVQVSITPVNDDPVASADSYSLAEDTPRDLNVLANDQDIDGDTLSVSVVTTPTQGTVAINADGTLRYTPASDFNGSDTFTYVVVDGQGGSATGSVAITVTAANDAPVAQADTATTAEDVAVGIAVLVNDTDADGDLLDLVGFSQAGFGVVRAGVAGELVYTPAADFNGSDSFSYTVQDATGLSANATVTVNVTAVNDDPLAQADTFNLTEDAASTSFAVAANDSDVDGDSLSVLSVSTPTSGSASLTGNLVNYTPAPNFNGSASFSYLLSDGQGGSATGSVTVVVAAVNDPPLAQADSAVVNEDTEASIPVLANDSDVDGDSLHLTAAGPAPNGSVGINADGSLSYTPAANFNGSDSFTYTVSDGRGGSATANVSVTVNPVNDAPVAVDDFATTAEDVAIALNVLGNDVDSDGDSLIVSSVSSPNQGSVDMDAAAQILTYQPPLNFNGTASFTYIVSDGRGGQDSASVQISVTAANDPVVASADAATTIEDQAVSIHVLANDSDADGDALSVDSVTAPANGTVAIQPDQRLLYTPAANFNGSDSFQYTVAAGTGFASATVSVTVTAVNDAPQANADSVSTDEDTAVVIAVLDNDSDVEDTTPVLVSAGPGRLGTTSVSAAGTVTYTPAANASGTDNFVYTVRDSAGATASTSVTVSIQAVNDAPVAAADTASTDEDQAVTIDVLANDMDPDGQTLTVANFSQGAHGSVVRAGAGLIYTPAPDFNGGDSFTYTLSDGTSTAAPATVSITVAAVNDVPVALGDSLSMDEDTTASLDVLANDSDVDGDVLSVLSVSTPAFGSASLVGGLLAYTPGANFNGADSFTYTITDGRGGSATTSVQVSVNPVNDAPLAVDDRLGMDEDTTVVFDLLGNDSDLDGDPLTIVGIGQPAHGTASINAGSQTVSYIPAANFSGIDNFIYTISDGQGGSASASVQVTVAAVNDPVLANADTATTPEDQAVKITVLGNDSDADGDALSVESVTSPTNGSVLILADQSLRYAPNANFYGIDSFQYAVVDGRGSLAVATVTVTVETVNDAPLALDDAATTSEDTAVEIAVLANDSDVEAEVLTLVAATSGNAGSASVTPNNTIIYTPAANFSGRDIFSYTVHDSAGASASATVTVTIVGVNDAPVAVADAISTAEDQAVSINVLANDSDPDGQALVVAGFSQGANGSVVRGSDERLIYTPLPNFNGGDSFSYVVSDGDITVSTSVQVTVSAVNDAPSVQADSANGVEDTPLVIDVLANDTDVDGDAVSVTGLLAPSSGSVSLSADGRIVYTPDSNFNGSDGFEYSIGDGRGGSASGTVNVAVAAVNDAPVAVDDFGSTREDTPLSLNLLNNDSDVDGDALSIVAVDTLPSAQVDVQIDAGGQSVTYTPALDFTGSVVFTYTVADTGNAQASASVQINVAAANDPVLASNDAVATDEDLAIDIDVLANDSDADGDLLSIESFTTPASGSLVPVGRMLRYTPNADFNGSDSFSYVAADGKGGSAAATVSVTVRAVNDAPLAVDDTAATDEDTAVMIAVLANDGDVESQALSLISATQGSRGTTQVNADNTVTYIPAANTSGQDTFTYSVSDAAGATASAIVTVVIGAVNDAPIAVADTAVTPEDQAVAVDVLANDLDPEGQSLSVVAFGQGGNGSVVSSPDGRLIYTPAADFAGTDSFTYTVSDGLSSAAPVAVSVTVTALNDTPIAGDDAVVVDENSSVVIDVLLNDTDVDGDALSLSGVFDSPTSGSVEIVAGLSLRYTPNPGFVGVDGFDYRISDGQGGSDSAHVTVRIVAANSAVVADPDSATTDEDVAVRLDVLANDSDPDGDTLLITGLLEPAPTLGVVSVAADGASLLYTPLPDVSGEDRFSYSVGDGRGSVATALVEVTIRRVNDAPLAVDDLVATGLDAPIRIDVLANDSDLDGDVLAVALEAQPVNGVALVNADGSIDYTPAPGFRGSDSFSYKLGDSTGASDFAVVRVSVGLVAELAAIDDVLVLAEDASQSIDVLANDLAPAGSALRLVGYTQPTFGEVSETAGGSLSYRPLANFSGLDEFTYQVSDGSAIASATVSIEVQGRNDAPQAVDDQIVLNGAEIEIDVMANDIDVDGDALTVTVVGTAEHGMVSIGRAGTLLYTAGASLVDSDEFIYTVSDGNGGHSNARVSIRLAQAPLADAGPDQKVADGVRVFLVGNGDDLDGPIASYQWIQVSGPGVALDTDSSASTSFMAPQAEGSVRLVFRLTVTDMDGLRHSDVTTVTVGTDTTAATNTGAGASGAWAPGILFLFLLFVLARGERAAAAWPRRV